MASKDNQVARVLNAANGDSKVVAEELQSLLEDFVHRHPSCGLGIAFLNKNNEDETTKSGMIIGQINLHEMLHAADGLMNMIMNEAKERDPAGLEAFMAELEVKAQMAQMAEALGGEDGPLGELFRGMGKQRRQQRHHN